MMYSFFVISCCYASNLKLYGIKFFFILIRQFRTVLKLKKKKFLEVAATSSTYGGLNRMTEFTLFCCFFNKKLHSLKPLFR